MEEIEVVINITKHEWEYLNKLVENGDQLGHHERLLVNGTPLPKGHGALKDVTNLMRGLYTDMQTIEETFTSSDVYKMIDEECPTIIEADKESKP